MARRKADFMEDKEDEQRLDDDTSAVSDDGLSSLRQLIFLGREEIGVEIDGLTFTLATLTSGQQRSMMKQVMALSDEERVPSMREAILCRSILYVNGEPLENFYDGDDADSLTDIKKRSLIISQMQFSVVEQLFVSYNKMIESEKEDSDENLKK